MKKLLILSLFLLIVTTLAFTTLKSSPSIQITMAQGQQKSSMCDPNDTSINSTESKICGVPATTGNATISSNVTTSVAPSSQ
jgi:hypothetical protein